MSGFSSLCVIAVAEERASQCLRFVCPLMDDKLLKLDQAETSFQGDQPHPPFSLLDLVSAQYMKCPHVLGNEEKLVRKTYV